VPYAHSHSVDFGDSPFHSSFAAKLELVAVHVATAEAVFARFGVFDVAQCVVAVVAVAVDLDVVPDAVDPFRRLDAGFDPELVAASVDPFAD